MNKMIIIGLYLGIFINSAKESLDVLLIKKKRIEGSIDKLEQEKRVIENRSYLQLQRCEQKVDGERLRRMGEQEQCKKTLKDLKKKERSLRRKILDLENGRNQAYEALSRTARSVRDLHEKIDILEEQLKREQSLSAQLAAEKTNLEMAQVELRTLIKDLQHRVEGKALKKEAKQSLAHRK